jgi:HSP20 family protein
MSDIAVTKSPTPQKAVTPRPTDPFTAMREEMERMMQRFDTGWPRLPMGLMPATVPATLVPDLDVRDDGKTIVVEADLPGVADADVHVTLTGDILTIKGEKRNEREDRGDSYYVAERSYGSFTRSLRLPDSIDEAGIAAKFEKGVLAVTIPRKPEAVRTEKRIDVTSA